jgi:hypothetical protein
MSESTAMRILVTNNGLALRAGTELFVRDIALGLRSRGHRVAVYSKLQGEVADDLRRAGIETLASLDELSFTPEIIHGQHHLETMTALARLPGTPAIYFCHGWIPWEELAPRHPRIMVYAAVDRPTRRAVARRIGVDPDAVRLLPGVVDLARFPARAPLPPAPRRALLFCNQVSRVEHLPPIRAACSRKKIRLDARGLWLGRPARRPERLLRRYDLVFAKGRAALEAAASGAAVIMCGAFGLGPLVTTANMRRLHSLEGDYTELCQPLEADRIVREIERYDPHDAAEVSRWVRCAANLEPALSALEALYAEAIGELGRRSVPAGAEAQASAAYLDWLSGQFKQGLTPRGPAVLVRNLLLALRARWPAGTSPACSLVEGRSARSRGEAQR